jgi:simple sugar transport system substrate-binding protein
LHRRIWKLLLDFQHQAWCAAAAAFIMALQPKLSLIAVAGMETTMTLADGTVEPTVDLMNAGKVGIDAISPAALPLIPQEIIDLVKQRREEMMKGTWDPFTAHEFVSNGTGLKLEGLDIPPAGKSMKPAGEVPTTEWLLAQFNFDLQGTTILK